MAYLGLIEGFYGKKFKPAARLSLLSFLKEQAQGSFYIYAPKEERALRQEFLAGLSQAACAQIKEVRAHCRRLRLDFGLGISPFNLTASYKDIKDKFLTRTAEYCTAFSPEILCLLFDDQKIEPDAAAVQHQIITDVLTQLPQSVKRFIICPTYYSFDPILEKLFGPRPADYFSVLMQGLPDKVEVFWTGPKVLSPDITPADLAEAAKLLGRRPFIWDNYPVNDGKKSSEFLNLKPFCGRRDLDTACSRHAVNPMLECELNKYVLKTLAQKYQGLDDGAIQNEFDRDLRAQLGGGRGADILMEQLHLLTDRPLSTLNALQKAMLIAACELERGNPAMQEIKDFLSGAYSFDPACLT